MVCKWLLHLLAKESFSLCNPPLRASSRSKENKEQRSCGFCWLRSSKSAYHFVTLSSWPSGQCGSRFGSGTPVMNFLLIFLQPQQYLFIHGPCASPQCFPWFSLFNILLLCPEIKGSSEPSFFTSPIPLVPLLEMQHKQTNPFTSPTWLCFKDPVAPSRASEHFVPTNASWNHSLLVVNKK